MVPRRAPAAIVTAAAAAAARAARAHVRASSAPATGFPAAQNDALDVLNAIASVRTCSGWFGMGWVGFGMNGKESAHGPGTCWPLAEQLPGEPLRGPAGGIVPAIACATVLGSRKAKCSSARAGARATVGWQRANDVR